MLSPTVMVPVLDAFPVFASTEKVTVPELSEGLPDETVIQLALLLALQAQPPGSVTAMLPVPPRFLNCASPESSEMEHAPSWEIVKT